MSRKKWNSTPMPLSPFHAMVEAEDILGMARKLVRIHARLR
jgi:hypothetical protein